MGRRAPPVDFNLMPITRFVKQLIIANVVIWFVGVVIGDQYIFTNHHWVTELLALRPFSVIRDFYVWQPFTYLFIHSLNPLHIVFTMLLLYFTGSQLERMWGTKFFALFYFVSGVGAAVIYLAVALAYSIIKGDAEVLAVPISGADAAIFGCLVAYAIYFGEQVMLFMFIFPMKAKYFVAILGGIEVIMVLNNGLIQGKVANLAHVGGLLSGYLFLKIWPRIRGGGQGGSRPRKQRQGKLKLVVNNEDFESQEKPTVWH